MKIRRPFRAVVYVAVIAAALGYVVFSAWRLPAWTNGTMVGTAIARWFGKPQPARPFELRPQALRFSRGWTVRPPSAIIDYIEIPMTSVEVRHDKTPRRWGIWHLVVELIPDEIHFRGRAEDALLNDFSERQLILEAINRSEWGPFVPADKLAFYASGGGTTRRILWLGVLGDLSILAAFAAIIFSLVKLRREIAWSKPGCCTECDYDLAGLSVEKCPECGAAVVPATRNKGA